MSNQDQADRLLTMDRKELAREMRLSPLTIARAERTRPEDLPPALIVGRGKRLYPRQGVEQWFLERAGLVVSAPAMGASAEKRKPGRPRKISALGE
jgi:hypothetical protein